MRELSLHVLDVLQNSLEAGATRLELTIEEDLKADKLTITATDNGRGMDEAMVSRTLDPFFTTRTTRHVGLGLPLFAAAAERCEGKLTVESQVGVGTKVVATFRHSHIDRAPLGDIKGTLLGVLLAEHDVDLYYRHRVDGREFAFNTVEIKRELDDVPLSHPAVRNWLSEFIAEGEEELSTD